MAAPIWTPLGGTEMFGFGSVSHREVIKYAAARRDIIVDPVTLRLYWLRREGRSALFFNHMPDTTSYVAREISNSKHLTKTMLAAAGIATPEGDVFPRSGRQKAWAYARSLGLPVVVKPLSGSGGGGVTPGVADHAHFRLAWDAASRTKNVVVERHVEGLDYRIFVVGDRAVCAALRDPAFVTGDGRSSVRALIAAKNRARAANRYVGGKSLKPSPMIARNIATLGLTEDSVPEAGRTLRLHEIANIGAGGESTDVTDLMHPEFAEIAVRARRAIPGVGHAGVDLLVPDISRAPSDQSYAIVEINSRPDIALHHFAFHGAARDAAGALLEHLFPGAAVVPRERWTAVALKLTGKVTGVGLRKALQRRAALAALTGWVQNDSRGAVSAYLCGPGVAVERIAAELAARRGAKVERRPADDDGLDRFEIRT